MPLFPFPMPSLIAWDVAAKVRSPIIAAASFLGRLGFDVTAQSPYNDTTFENFDPFSDVTGTMTQRTGVRWYPKDFCFIRVIDGSSKGKDSVIAFQFMPRTIGDVKSAIYQDIQIIGRSSPFKSYSASSARTISFTLDFYASPEAGDATPSPGTIKNWITQLQALLYPIYEDYNVSPPPKCIVHVGDQVNMLGVCKNVSVNYNAQQVPWTTINRTDGFYIFGASVNLTFEEVKEIPVGYYEKIQGFDEAPATNQNIVTPSDEMQGPPLPDGVDGLPTDTGIPFPDQSPNQTLTDYTPALEDIG